MTQLLQTGDGSAAADQARAQGRPSPHPSVHLLHKRIQLLQLLHHTGEERNARQEPYSRGQLRYRPNRRLDRAQSRRPGRSRYLLAVQTQHNEISRAGFTGALPPSRRNFPSDQFWPLGGGGESITRQGHKPLLLLLSSTLGSRQEKAHPTLLTGARRATRHARCAHAASPPGISGSRTEWGQKLWPRDANL
jgi:hypothetical protein